MSEANITIQPEALLAPHNAEAEQALLGAILANNARFDDVAFLRPEHFYDPAHGRIWAAIAGMIGGGHPASPVTLRNRFAEDDDLEDVGGAQYLADLAGSAMPGAEVADYGALVYDLWLRREEIALFTDGLRAARNFDIALNGRGVAEAAMDRLVQLVGAREAGGLEPMPVWVDRAVAAAERAEKARIEGRLIGIPTGLRDLDEFMDGLERGRLTIVGARPGMGKSVLGFNNVAYGAAQAGFRVAVFSLEMSGEELAFRVLAAMTGLSYRQISRGHMPADGWDKVIKARESLSRLRDRLFIDDGGAQSVQSVVSAARALARRWGGLDLVVVDHGGLMETSDWARQRSSGNRTQDVSEITRGLKIQVAKGLGVACLCLWQLSRQVEQRSPPRPMLADLRDSGSIEQDADQVIFIYREEVYAERDKPARRGNESDDALDRRTNAWREHLIDCADKAELIVAKQRVGPTGTVHVGFKAPESRFFDLGGGG